MIRPPFTTSMTGPDTTSSASFLASIVPHARLVLRALLRQDQPAVLVFLREDERLDVLADRHDLVRVDVVADRQFLGRNHAFGLVSDVEEHLVGVDLHDRSGNEAAVVELDDRRVDRVCERAFQVVED